MFNFRETRILSRYKLATILVISISISICQSSWQINLPVPPAGFGLARRAPEPKRDAASKRRMLGGISARGEGTC